MTFYVADRGSWGLTFDVIVLLHYLVSYDCILRLLQHK